MTASATTRPPARELRHRIMAGFIGNVVEWYDFALYGDLAGIIAPVFFPATSPTAGLIATYGIFAAGFVMRPLGAAVFGWFGDRYGRARTMQISVTMMALPTLLLGLLSSYRQAGIAAPILLLLVRLVQGLSVARRGWIPRVLSSAAAQQCWEACHGNISGAQPGPAAVGMGWNTDRPVLACQDRCTRRLMTVARLGTDPGRSNLHHARTDAAPIAARVQATI